ncbi:Crp/Fnr family transcriptional regulator [Acinetobacter sp. Marseille-Q1618]|uniref:Crp/Fnr family transcriptional regulator n=1 Tax=Acinetobacter sp. Marseille-Q1618 TaxID=2697502 RepID=UPI00156F2F6B|nr:Crp/Fnr family transcriptional regulator [Acinetobacter sp. Marseille-Q1618]
MQYYDLNYTSNHYVLKNIFKSLSLDRIEYILNQSIIKKFNKNELILNKGTCSDALYILLDGIIHIGYLSTSGRFHAFNFFSEKNLINLLPCLKGHVIDYDYYAFNQVRVLIIPKHIFHQELNDNNKLNEDLLDIVAFRMHHLIEEVKFLHIANLHQKICKTLLSLSKQYGIHHAQGIEILLKISQHDLADLLSSSRQTVNKEVKKLVNLNVIEWQYENIIVKDIEYFKRVLNDI